MKTPHKHAEMIREWVLDTSRKVEFRNPCATSWIDIEDPSWSLEYEYRFKPTPKPDHRIYTHILNNSLQFCCGTTPNVVFTFDGETGKLKDAKVLK